MTSAVAAPARAGLVSRLAALFVDAVILSVAVGGTTWFAEVVARALGRFAPPGAGSISHLVLAGGIPLLSALYHVTFWRVTGQTPGKWLLGLKVQRLDGGPLTLGQALLRFVGYLVSALPFYAGFLWVLGPRRRTWHDRLAGTEVVYVRPAPQEPSGNRIRRMWAEALAGPPSGNG
jgi:uncharacterized RDD family membrane protein YckC